MIETDVIESRIREKMKTKWRFSNMTNLTVIAVSFKDVHMVCKDAVSPEPLMRNHTVNCLTFEENTRQPYTGNLSFIVLLLFLCAEIKSWKEKNIKKFHFLHEKSGRTQHASVPRSPNERYCSRWGTSASEHFPLMKRHFGWKKHRWTRSKEGAKNESTVRLLS